MFLFMNDPFQPSQFDIIDIALLNTNNVDDFGRESTEHSPFKAIGLHDTRL
jgi:hypothetical protein